METNIGVSHADDAHALRNKHSKGNIPVVAHISGWIGVIASHFFGLFPKC